MTLTDPDVESAHGNAPSNRSPEQAEVAPPGARRWRRWLADGVLLAVMIAAVAWAWPAQFGGSTSYVIVSGRSMAPTYENGDIVITRPGDVSLNDIVVYRVPEGDAAAGAQVVHRVVGGNGEAGWELLGDNNASADQWRPTDDDVVGRVVLHLPGAGRLLLSLAHPLLFSALIIAGALLLLWPTRDEPENGEAAEANPSS